MCVQSGFTQTICNINVLYVFVSYLKAYKFYFYSDIFNKDNFDSNASFCYPVQNGPNTRD